MSSREMLALCALLAGAQTQRVQLVPVDDTARDSSFRSYVEKLRSAVQARDVGALRKLVDKDVVSGPAKDDKGWTKFQRRWLPGGDRTAPVWDALAELLSMGFHREHPSLFLSPYVAWRFPRDLDPRTHLVVVRDKADLREAPSLKAVVVASLEFDIVRKLGRTESEGLVQWELAETMDGSRGWINKRDVASPMMPRAQFVLTRGRWYLVALER